MTKPGNVINFDFYDSDETIFEVGSHEFIMRSLTAKEFKKILSKKTDNDFQMADEIIRTSVTIKETGSPIDLEKVSLKFYNELCEKVVKTFSEINGLDDQILGAEDEEKKE